MTVATLAPTSPARSSALRSPFSSPLVLALLAAFGVYGTLGPADFMAVVRDLRLPDPDDAMRLVEVRDFLAGQPWFDLVQHRQGLPPGVPSHWSRLVDLPIAGLVSALAPLAGARLAEGLTAALWPAAVFALYAVLLVRATWARFGARAACLALFAAGQTGAVVGVFPFGRIDHHNVQATAAFAIGLCLVRAGRGGRIGTAAGAGAGALGALSLAVGLESFPFVAGAGLFLAAEWCGRGGAALPAFRAFGLALAGGAAVLFLAQTAPALWGATACDALSPPWLWLAATGAVAGGGGTFGARAAGPGGRAALLLGIGALGAVGFATLFPACAGSPFAALPPAVRAGWLAEVSEMRPVFAQLAVDPAGRLGYGAPAFLAALVALVLSRRGAPEHRRTFAVAALFLGLGAIIALFQVRGLYVCGGFLPLVAGAVLDRALTTLDEAGASPARRAGLLVLAVALLSRSWAFAIELPRHVLAPAVVAQQVEVSEVSTACLRPAGLAALDALPTGRLLAPIDFGPALLLHTHHAVASAPYHRDIAGLEIGLAAFGGDEAALRNAVRRSGATYLAACPGRVEFGAASSETFAARLARGEVAVPWLTPADVPGTALKVWRIAPAPTD